MSSPRILILWAKPTATNLGIRALAEGAEALCRRAWPNAEIVLHDHDTAGTPLGKRPILADIGRNNGFIKEMARGFDLVLDTGSGDSFTDIYGIRRLIVMTYVHDSVLRSGTPLVLSPQTIGPYKTRIGRFVGSRSLRRAQRVFARDSESADFAASLGRIVDAASSDVVWMLDQPAKVVPADVVFNVSGLLWRENPHVNYAFYRESCAAFVDRTLRSGREVTLLAHVLSSEVSPESDVNAVEGLASEMGKREGLSICVPESLNHVRSLMAGSRVVVGARMHACLNALSVGTPSIPWAYSRKFGPLLKDIGWSHVLDLRETDNIVDATIELLTADLNPEADECARNARAGFDSVVSSLQMLLASSSELTGSSGNE